MIDVETIIAAVDTLKPVSHVASKVLEISCNPNSSLAEIVDVIKYDPATTASILKICNASYFGLKRKISSIKQAVTFLGLEKLVNMVVMKVSAENFKAAQKGYDLKEGELWRYSVASALIAQDLAEKKHCKNAPLIFTSALLKDIGKLVLHIYVRDAFDNIMTLVQRKNFTFVEAEKEIIGIDHAELGARIAEKWHFEQRMVEIIRNHHDPTASPPEDLTIPIVYLADSICMMIGVSGSSDGLAYRYHQNVLDLLRFSDTDLQHTIANFWAKIGSVDELIYLSRGEVEV